MNLHADTQWYILGPSPVPGRHISTLREATRAGVLLGQGCCPPSPPFQSASTAALHLSEGPALFLPTIIVGPPSSQQPFSLLLVLPPMLHAPQGCELTQPR